MKNVDKWFADPKIELTVDNAKEFFYDFDCNPSFMEGRLADYKQLNIPKEIIISWTTAFYKEDILKYESLNLRYRLFYIYVLSGILEQFEKSFIVKLSEYLLVLLDIPELYEIGDYRFLLGESLINDIGITDKFYGYIPSLYQFKQYELIEKMLIKFTNIYINYPDKFKVNSGRDIKIYYEKLLKFSEKHNLNFDSIIMKLKS